MPDTRYGIIVNTWKNMSLGALHYYTYAWREEETENGPKVQKEQALYALTSEQAETMNFTDGLFERDQGNPYREGDLSWRFEDEKTAIAAALAQILRWTGGVRAPVGIGEPYYTEPDEWINWDDYERLELVPADGEPPPEAPVDPRLEVHADLKAPKRR